MSREQAVVAHSWISHLACFPFSWTKLIRKFLIYFCTALISTEENIGASTFLQRLGTQLCSWFLESSELTMDRINAMSFPYNGKIYFTEFDKELPGWRVTVWRVDNDTPSNWKFSLICSQRFFVSGLKGLSSHFSFVHNFGIRTRMIDANLTYFTSRLENKSSLAFRFFSIAWNTSSSKNIFRLYFSARRFHIVASWNFVFFTSLYHFLNTRKAPLCVLCLLFNLVLTTGKRTSFPNYDLITLRLDFVRLSCWNSSAVLSHWQYLMLVVWRLRYIS